MNYETSLKIHKALKTRLGDKMPSVAPNAPVWSDGSPFLRLQLDSPGMTDDERITGYLPDYSSAANSLLN